MLTKIQEVFKEVFDVAPEEVTLASHRDDFDEWDSMRQLELISALEKKFKVKFTMDEMIKIDSVQEIVKLVEHKQ